MVECIQALISLLGETSHASVCKMYIIKAFPAFYCKHCQKDDCLLRAQDSQRSYGSLAKGSCVGVLTCVLSLLLSQDNQNHLWSPTLASGTPGTSYKVLSCVTASLLLSETLASGSRTPSGPASSHAFLMSAMLLSDDTRLPEHRVC